MNRLGQAQALYLQPLRDYVLPIIHDTTSSTSTPQQSVAPSKATHLASKLRRDLDSVITHSVPLQLVSKALRYVLFDAACHIFDVHPGQADRRTPTREDVLHARNRTVRLLRGLQEVGLAGDQAQRAFAHAMDKLLGQFIVSHHMKVDWYGRAPVTKKLRRWIKEGFAPFATEVMECLNAGGPSQPFGPLEIQQWQDMATQWLGRARVGNLFDYVVNWDRSLGAILDLKVCITSTTYTLEERVTYTITGLHHHASNSKPPRHQFLQATLQASTPRRRDHHPHPQRLHLRHPRLQ